MSSNAWAHFRLEIAQLKGADSSASLFLTLHPPRLASWEVWPLQIGWGWTVSNGKDAGKVFLEWHTCDLMSVSSGNGSPELTISLQGSFANSSEIHFWAPLMTIPSHTFNATPLTHVWHPLSTWTVSSPRPGWSHIASSHSIMTGSILIQSQAAPFSGAYIWSFVPLSKKAQLIPSSSGQFLPLGFLLERIRPQFQVHQMPGDKCEALQVDLLKPLIILPCSQDGRSPRVKALD